MTNKPTSEIYHDLRKCGMPPSDLYHMIDMRIEGYNHQPAPPKERAEEIEFYQLAEISRLKRALRDILTMHAIRWLILDNDGAVDAHFWADDGVMLELDGRKKLIGDTHADLLEAIHAAAMAMKGSAE